MCFTITTNVFFITPNQLNKSPVFTMFPQSEVTFMPSAGIEFVTQVGSHIPEYVNSGLEMHTNLFHESGLSAKISMGRDNVKLTIPAPMKPTKLMKMT